MQSDARWAFDAYQAVRSRLPGAEFPSASRLVSSLEDLADGHDVFLLDAFGVLNFGDTAIAGVPDRVARLRAMGKRVIVVTNAASYPKRVALQRYARLGYDFTAEDVVSSRDALLAAVADMPGRRWGLMAPEVYGREALEALDVAFLGDRPEDYATAEGVILLGSGEWTEARQALLTAALRGRPRPVLVGNPDIVAPYEGGLSREPGHFAHRLADETGISPQFFGKPFGNVFDLALARVPGVPLDRIVMVGDTLQTDILGGRAAGLRTALVTGHGALRGMDAQSAIAASGIVPDFIMETP